jgi:hypothetical protein
MCPHCQQNAPIAYRGLAAYCTACGRPRAILSASSVTMAGKTSQLGGVVVRTLGWAVLVGGAFIALIMGLMLSLISQPVGLVGGLLLAIFTLAVALPMLFGGKRLETSGDDEKKSRQVQAIFALAANRGGILRAGDVATSLQLNVDSADALLTDLAKKRGDDIDVDVTDQGEVVYKFPRLFFVGGSAWAGQSAPGRVRVAEPVMEQGMPRAAVEPQVIDAEFEEIDDAAKRARRQA